MISRYVIKVVRVRDVKVNGKVGFPWSDLTTLLADRGLDVTIQRI
jgi:hypothetical protein